MKGMAIDGSNINWTELSIAVRLLAVISRYYINISVWTPGENRPFVIAFHWYILEELSISFRVEYIYIQLYSENVFWTQTQAIFYIEPSTKFIFIDVLSVIVQHYILEMSRELKSTHVHE